MEWELVTEDNPAPKTGRQFLACYMLGNDYLSKEYPIWWCKRTEKWINWPVPFAGGEHKIHLMYLYPNADTFFKEKS